MCSENMNTQAEREIWNASFTLALWLWQLLERAENMSERLIIRERDERSC